MYYEVPNLDQTDVSGGYKPPGGDYICEIIEEPEPGTTKNGNPNLKVNLRIIAAKLTQNSEAEGNSFTDYIVLSGSDPKKNFRFKALLISSGILAQDDETSEIARGRIDLAVLVGKKVNIRVTQRMYEGKPQSDVTYLVN